MASASTTSARSLFVDSKNRLADRVQVNVNNIASIVRQVQRGSKSHEVSIKNCVLYFPLNDVINHKFNFQLMMQSATQFAHQERAIENTENVRPSFLFQSNFLDI